MPGPNCLILALLLLLGAAHTHAQGGCPTGCPAGQFQDPSCACYPCTTCPPGDLELSPCTATNDTACSPPTMQLLAAATPPGGVLHLTQDEFLGSFACGVALSGVSLTIVGRPGGGTTLNCAPDMGLRHFDLSGGATLTLVNLTLSGGTPTGPGGSVRAIEGSRLEATGVTFRGSTSGGPGGAVSLVMSEAVLTDCVFDGSVSSSGEGDAVSASGIAANLTVRGGIVDESAASGSSVVLEDGAVGTFLNVKFESRNVASTVTAGTYINNTGGGAVVIDTCLFLGELRFPGPAEKQRAYLGAPGGTPAVLRGAVVFADLWTPSGGLFAGSLVIEPTAVVTVAGGNGGTDAALTVPEGSFFNVSGRLEVQGAGGGAGGCLSVKAGGTLNVLPGGSVSASACTVDAGGQGAGLYVGGAFNVQRNAHLQVSQSSTFFGTGGGVLVAPGGSLSFSDPPYAGSFDFSGNTAAGQPSQLHISTGGTVDFGPGNALAANLAGDVFVEGGCGGDPIFTPSEIYGVVSAGSCPWRCMAGYALNQAPNTTKACLSLGGPAAPLFRNSTQAQAELFCAPGCMGSLVGDGTCHVECLSAQCAWDLLDCRGGDGFDWAAARSRVADSTVPGTVQGAPVPPAAARRDVLELIIRGDDNLDKTIDEHESAAAFKLSPEQHAAAAGGGGGSPRDRRHAHRPPPLAPPRNRRLRPVPGGGGAEGRRRGGGQDR